MKYIISGLLITAVIGLGGCKKEAFVEANTNPNTVYSISPEEQFLNVARRAHNNDFEAYYDFYRRIMPWMQMDVPLAGNTKNFLTDIGNFNQRYGTFFPELGAAATDVQKIIEAKPAEEQAAYAQVHDIAEIMKIQYAFYVSDINGSIPYTDAFQARYGGTLTPAYQTQEELFELWDQSLKQLVNDLLAAPSVNQVSLGRYDLYFGGDPLKWAKAANALRMRIALRWMKRDMAKATAIAADATATAAQMESNADGWVMYADVTFTNGGNFNPVDLRAPKPTVDFMWDNSDPRLRNFYQKNAYTEANFNTAKAAGLYPSGATWNPRQYVGAPTSPDASQGIYKNWFTPRKVSDALSLDTLSFIQYRMWQPATPDADGALGEGDNFLPVITYADYCFMRAEFIARNMVSGDAEEWYNKGVTASINFYDQAAKNAKLLDYTQLGASEIADYLNMADVKYDPGKAIELIIVQAYINFYKQPNEAWANYKRTGYPNNTSVLANEEIVIDGVVRQIPRRAALTVPAETDQSFETRQAALDQMAQDPSFGNGPGDVFGRVWWDVQ